MLERSETECLAQRRPRRGSHASGGRGTHHALSKRRPRRGSHASGGRGTRHARSEYVRSAHRSEDFIGDGRPEIAFVGRSNVGKSSLLNALASSRQLARTGRTPGRTRAVNYFLVDDRYYLVDLPGYGYAKAGRDDRQRLARVSESYLERQPGRRVVLLVDSKVGATPLDVLAFRFLVGVGAEVVVAATKSDQIKRGERERQRRSIRESLELPEETPFVFVSARTGEGLNELWREVWPLGGRGSGGAVI